MGAFCQRGFCNRKGSPDESSLLLAKLPSRSILRNFRTFLRASRNKASELWLSFHRAHICIPFFLSRFRSCASRFTHAAGHRIPLSLSLVRDATATSDRKIDVDNDANEEGRIVRHRKLIPRSLSQRKVQRLFIKERP